MQRAEQPGASAVLLLDPASGMLYDDPADWRDGCMEYFKRYFVKCCSPQSKASCTIFRGATILSGTVVLFCCRLERSSECWSTEQR